MQATISLVQLLDIWVVRLADLLAAVKRNEALARHGPTEPSMTLIDDNPLPLVQAAQGLVQLLPGDCRQHDSSHTGAGLPCCKDACDAVELICCQGSV